LIVGVLIFRISRRPDGSKGGGEGNLSLGIGCVLFVCSVPSYRTLSTAKVGIHYSSLPGIATASYGMPDLGITNLNDVAEDVRRITNMTKLPLLVDIGTTIFRPKTSVHVVVQTPGSGPRLGSRARSEP